jgi:Domain of unknown function (DUF4440)
MYKFAALVTLAFTLGFSWQQPDDANLSPEQREQLKRMQRIAAYSETQREEIAVLEHETVHAIKLSDSTFFRRVYSDEFSGTLSHGQIVSKSTFLDAVQTRDVKYEAFNASDLDIRIYERTAVATCLWSARGTFNNQHFSSQMRVMHVYVNTPDGWRAVAGQFTLLPPGAIQPL